MVRLVGIALGLAVAVGAGVAMRVLDPARKPDVMALQLLEKSGRPDKQVIELFTEAVLRDSANPYRWAELGQALADANEIARARPCFLRAVELSRDVPQIWLRAANFYLQIGEPEHALELGAKVVRTVPDYDSVLFNYFTQFDLGPDAVLAQIGGDRRASNSYLKFLIDQDMMDQAATVWNRAFAARFVDEQLACSYVDGMIHSKRFEQATQAWEHYTGREDAGHVSRNLLFNGGFERDPSGCTLDWKVTSSPEVTTTRVKEAHDGHWALHLQFSGTANVSGANVVQMVSVQPRNYTLRAWIRQEALTTNEGPRLEIIDAEAPNRVAYQSESLLGTHDWSLLTRSVTIPSGTNLVAIRVARQASQKFDNKIAGALWLDSVELTRR